MIVILSHVGSISDKASRSQEDLMDNYSVNFVQAKQE